MNGADYPSNFIFGAAATAIVAILFTYRRAEQGRWHNAPISVAASLALAAALWIPMVMTVIVVALYVGSFEFS